MIYLVLLLAVLTLVYVTLIEPIIRVTDIALSDAT